MINQKCQLLQIFGPSPVKSASRNLRIAGFPVTENAVYHDVRELKTRFQTSGQTLDVKSAYPVHVNSLPVGVALHRRTIHGPFDARKAMCTLVFYPALLDRSQLHLFASNLSMLRIYGEVAFRGLSVTGWMKDEE
jgi:hypothetical protein